RVAIRITTRVAWTTRAAKPAWAASSTRSRPGGWRRAARINHRAGELVDRHTRIRHDLFAIGGHRPEAIDGPPDLVRFIVPEVEAGTRQLAYFVGVNQPRSSALLSAFKVGAAWLHGKVDR